MPGSCCLHKRQPKQASAAEINHVTAPSAATKETNRNSRRDKHLHRTTRRNPRRSSLLEPSLIALKSKGPQASDLAVGYAKEEPIKALLIAAAAGALLMGLVSMMARSND